MAKEITAAVLLGLAAVTAQAQAEPKDYSVALAAAKMLNPVKSQFETLDDFVVRVAVDCEAKKSPLCESVKLLNKEAFLSYSPEKESVQFLGFSTSFSLETITDPSTNKMYCTKAGSGSFKESQYRAGNAMGATTTVRKFVGNLTGIVFVADTPIPMGWASGNNRNSHMNYMDCYDKVQFLDPASTTGSQIIKVSKSDAKREGGKFIFEVIGTPVAPYIYKLEYFKTPTFTSPDEVHNKLTALVIKPTHLRFLGAVTKMVYAEFEYK